MSSDQLNAGQPAGWTVKRLCVAVFLVVAGVGAFVWVAGQRAAATVHGVAPPMPFDQALLVVGGMGGFVVGVLLLCGQLWRGWRARRYRTGHYTRKQVVARRQQLAAAEHAGEAWQNARLLGSVLAEGRTPEPLRLWGVVLERGETAHLDLLLGYARWSGGDASYIHVSGFYWGSAPFIIAGGLITAMGNASRRNAAQAEAMQRWREHRDARVIVTDRRILCEVDGRWLSFPYTAVIAFYPEPATWSVVLDFPDTAPLMLTGTAAPMLAIYAAARLHGRDALTSHPGLEPLRLRNHLGRNDARMTVDT